MNKYDIQALKSSLRIEGVIGRYVALQRRGNSYTGCCPFHTDRHPSLSVSLDKQSFTCFACGEKGDVFAFIEKIEHCTFLEAVGKMGGTKMGKMTHPLPPLERGKVTISSTQTSDIVDIASGVSNSPLERGKGVCDHTSSAHTNSAHTSSDHTNRSTFLNTLLPYASGDSDLSAAHIALLTQYTSRVYLLLDGDRAGQEATRKALPQLLAARIEAEGIRLPEGEDPDSLFRKWGKTAFTAMIRKALAAPHSSESALLTACLLYPEAVYPFKGDTYRFAELLYAVLPTDNLQFANSDYWQILKHLSEGAPEATLPAPLQMVADELHIAFDRLLAHDLETLAAILPESQNQVSLYFGKLLYLYTEVRLLGDIRRAVQRLLDTPSANREKRTDILIYIAGRRELLRHVSECIERPGVIPA